MNPESLFSRAQSRKRDFRLAVARLRAMKGRQLDQLVGGLHEEAFRHIDCLECANCCRTLGPRLLPKDVERMAARLKMKTAAFMQEYLLRDEDGDLVFCSMPCPFLLPDNHCMVYEARPRACREYPHTDQKNIRTILTLCIKNTETCPVVYEIFNRLAD
ncbi:MAG: YkgJ family cysteine cluster protein [Bacteroidales bacterium]